MTPLLEFRGIGKRFGGVPALAGVDLALARGEIHALLGENGAGKTTLVRTAIGLVRPDSGALLVDGRAVALPDPAAAARHGIGMVHQHFTLAPGLTVAENLLLGTAPALFTRRALERRARAALLRHGVTLDPARRVRELAVGERQHLEIAKALERGGRVLILDEPTAVLAPAEADALFERLEALRAAGRAVLLITHRLDEVLQVAQRVTVLRAGRVVLAAARADVSAATLTEALFGGGLERPPARRGAAATGATVLRARTLSGPGFGPVDLELRAGECVLIAGVDGHGQGELIETLVGLRRPAGGRLERPRRGIAFVSGDRHATGLALDLSVAENVALRPGLLPRPWYSRRELAAAVAPALARFDVRREDPWQPARSLSGGNQQRVVLARELAAAPALVLAENPTRGLDLRSARLVRGELRAAVAGGAAALVATTDLDEALELADRLLVAHRGRLHPCDVSRTAVARTLAGLAAGAAA